jgi:hypothetical protein
MFPITRFLGLAAVGVFVALTAASSPARADGSTQNAVGQADLNPQEMGECRLHRRAISRHVCQARLVRGVLIDTAENK